VIGTASRPESQQWVTELGAHHAVDHHGDLVAAVREVAPTGVNYIFTPFSAGNVERFAELLRPRGEITAIDAPEGLDLIPLNAKSLTWHWEMMFTRPLFTPEDPAQHELLEATARLVDDGVLRTTMARRLQPINAATLRQAHELVESGTMTGKVVITGAFQVPGLPGPFGIRWDGVRERNSWNAGVEQGDAVQTVLVPQGQREGDAGPDVVGDESVLRHVQRGQNGLKHERT
jgi:Zinc-binding dehydrogenase